MIERHFFFFFLTLFRDLILPLKPRLNSKDNFFTSFKDLNQDSIPVKDKHLVGVGKDFRYSVGVGKDLSR